MVSQVPEHTHICWVCRVIPQFWRWAGVDVERAHERGGWTSRFTKHLGVGSSAQGAGGGLPNPHLTHPCNSENTDPEPARRSETPATPKIGVNYAARRGSTASRARATTATKASGSGAKKQKLTLTKTAQKARFYQLKCKNLKYLQLWAEAPSARLARTRTIHTFMIKLDPNEGS